MTGTLPEVFARARQENRAAVIGYLPAGFPTKERSIGLIRAMIAAGVDVVEVGIPYSDPVMDGPVICEAAEIALQQGITPKDTLDVVRACSDGGAAILVMTYWNLVESFGPTQFAAELAAAGGSGAITPDLTPEEAGEWISACDELDLSHIFLAAPSSQEDRLARICSASSGFVYAASLMGVTGARGTLGSGAPELVGRLRRHTDTPLAVGLGVSTGAQAAQVAQFADGVIVGSAFVRRVLTADTPAAAEDAVTEFTRELVTSVQRP